MTFQRIRIYSHLTRTTFLHVEDALVIGKVRLFAGRYSDEPEALLQHYIDVPDARSICHALAHEWHDFEHREFKGTPLDNGKAVSRVLQVQAKPERVFFELSRGPGQLTATGAVSPRRRDDPTIPRDRVNVLFDWPQARRMALEVLAFLQAWDLARLLAHRTHLSDLPPFPLSPVSAEDEGEGNMTVEEVADTENSARTHIVAAPAALPRRKVGTAHRASRLEPAQH